MKFKSVLTRIADSIGAVIDAGLVFAVVLLLFGFGDDGWIGDAITNYLLFAAGYNVYAALLPYRTFPDDGVKPDEPA